MKLLCRILGCQSTHVIMVVGEDKVIKSVKTRCIRCYAENDWLSWASYLIARGMK